MPPSLTDVDGMLAARAEAESTSPSSAAPSAPARWRGCRASTTTPSHATGCAGFHAWMSGLIRRFPTSCADTSTPTRSATTITSKGCRETLADRRLRRPDLFRVHAAGFRSARPRADSSSRSPRRRRGAGSGARPGRTGGHRTEVDEIGFVEQIGRFGDVTPGHGHDRVRGVAGQSTRVCG
ncbi:hypothetical protein LT493_00770 [Streptomyces tricolor]|nr:hypothetical protein [Streptomyces tricolor]